MDTIIYYICVPLGWLMKMCWKIFSNYGLAIILFTLFTKVVLMPISVWIQKNSILMVKIQPEVNFLKANMQGNIDAIAEGQQKIFKREHYHPMLSLIPLVLQLVLLLAVVYIIYHPLSYLFNIADSNIKLLADFIGANQEESSFQLSIIDAIKSGQISATEEMAGKIGIDFNVLQSIVSSVKGFDLKFLGMNLLTIPEKALGWYFLVPIFAGFSSWLLCWTQNMSNVIQHEQGNLNKYGIMALSVALSLYLGFFVPSGIALYWIYSNLFSIAIMYLLNWLINPKKYVDYEALEASRKALAAAKDYGKIDKKDPQYKLCKQREKKDYKAFKKIANKHIVFYSEKSGFYKYYKELIEELLKRSNITIHYVTNDYNDVIFDIAKKEPRIKPYYISLKKMVLLMMLVETDMFVMTTPDLDKYYLKRSYIKKDIEYVYAPHDLMSMHFGFNEGAFDAFDTILCSGQHIVDEVRGIEKAYNLKPKTLVEYGYPLVDKLIEDGDKANEERKKNPSKTKEILIAPSWQEDNLMDSVLDGLIENLTKEPNFHVTVRPHPEYIKRYGYKLNAIMEKYKDFDPKKLSFEVDFSKNKSIYTSDILITDWSAVAVEFCFATKRPAVFINTKMKCLNKNWEKVNIEPVDLKLRHELGVALDKDQVNSIAEVVKKLFKEAPAYEGKIKEILDSFVFNRGKAAEVGAKYILSSIANKNKKEKK